MDRLDYMIDSILISLASWSCIFALLGIVRRYLTFSNPFLSYANEAVLPFYILHQPVILSVGFFVAGWAIPATWEILYHADLCLHRDHGDL